MNSSISLSITLNDQQLEVLAERIALQIRNHGLASISHSADEPMLTREEAAKKLNVSLNGLQTMVAKHRLRRYRIGRRVLFKFSELLEDLRRVEQASQGQ